VASRHSWLSLRIYALTALLLPARSLYHVLRHMTYCIACLHTHIELPRVKRRRSVAGSCMVYPLNIPSLQMSSTASTPPSVTGSTKPSSRKSSPPSSPAQASPSQGKSEDKESAVQAPNTMEQDDEDEEMDQKSRALTNLLKTSSVFVAIMAEKMREQQRRNQEHARREAAKRHAAETHGTEHKGPTRKSTRAHDTENVAPNAEEKEPETKRTRGRPRKTNVAAKKNITDYFGKGIVDASQTGPSVQEAIAEAAGGYEGEALGGQDLIATEQPKLVTGGKMKQYQLEGLEWLKTLWMNGLSGILADEMGLGKTLQAISLIAFFKENNISGPFLVAAPLSTVRNWIEEFKFWTPTINTIMYHGSKDEREEMRRKRMRIQDQRKPEFPVVVTSYEICMNDKKFLASYQWKYIIVDEGHRLKNMNCRLIKDLMSYQSANRLLITGTPLQNNIAELWSLLHFLLPEVFNDLDSFEKWFDFSSVLEDKTGTDGKAERRKNNLVSTMHAILKPFLLRRVKSDVESSLPKKREYILYAPLTAEQKELYREILAGTSRSYLEEKAVERIEARSRTASLKRKNTDSGRSTPAKSIKASRDSTPASMTSTSSIRRGRKTARTRYRDISDRAFNAKLRRLERGQEDEEDESFNETPLTPAESSEAEEIERAQTLKLAKMEIASKKLQNPIMQARLACNSPHNFYWPWGPRTAAEEASGNYPRVDESLVTASGKILLLDRLLPRLFSLKHKVLIFSQFTTTLDILQTYATELRGWPCCRIDGSVSQDERYEQIKNFNSEHSKYNLFLLSTRAGGLGINLTAADTVILFDSDWNPQQDIQAMDRVHRIGQTKPVIVYRLATRGTVEETLLLKADSKRKLEKLVIQKGQFKSLLDDGGRSRRLSLSGKDADEIRDILAEDEFEKYDVGQILTDEELQILTDRSDKAYERAEKGLDLGGEGKAFKVAETKRDGGNVLDDLTTKSTHAAAK